jgi:glycosyltransferase involved in cell wall biosynthesis
MGAGTSVLAWDVVFNREVAGTAGLYFDGEDQLARQFAEVERYSWRFQDIGDLMQERARANYDWDTVTEAYETLAAKLARGYSTRGISTGRRRDSAWFDTPAVARA